MLLLLVSLAHAGYGDAAGGQPTAVEREVVLWTNAVRAAPDAFEDDYAVRDCSYDDFTAEERVPKGPLAWNADLGRVARAHSADMIANDWFEHDSSDGTPPDERIEAAYDGDPIGENIAFGYARADRLVRRALMCSPHHRANLLAGDYDEVGVGVVEDWYTQDFGGGREDRPPIAMGAHALLDDGRFGFYADHAGEPDAFRVVLDGEAIPLSLRWGSPEQGIWGAELDPEPWRCHQLHFEAEVGGALARFPEEGSYGWGDCAFDDPAAGWFADRREIGDLDGLVLAPEPDPDGAAAGCNSSGGAAGGLGALIALLAARRRRLRRADA